MKRPMLPAAEQLKYTTRLPSHEWLMKRPTLPAAEQLKRTTRLPSHKWLMKRPTLPATERLKRRLDLIQPQDLERQRGLPKRAINLFQDKSITILRPPRWFSNSKLVSKKKKKPCSGGSCKFRDNDFRRI
jgi:hypothetical protein